MTLHFHLKTRSAAKLAHISATSALPSPLVWHREIIEGETLTYCGHRVEETLGADPRLFRFICLLAWRNIPCRPSPSPCCCCCYTRHPRHPGLVVARTPHSTRVGCCRLLVAVSKTQSFTEGRGWYPTHWCARAASLSPPPAVMERHQTGAPPSATSLV